jgi:hypothetical protein
MDSPSTSSGACTWKLALGGAAAMCLGALLAGARPASTASGRCVGMFLDSPGRAGALPDTIPADATNLVVRGTVPCRDQIMGWSPRGPMRVFEDGTVEFLASPVPPCPGGDYYVWIAFPK